MNAALFFLSDVPNRSAYNQCNNCYYDDIIHENRSFLKLLLQCILSGQILIGLIDQMNNHSNNCCNGDQTGQETCAEGTGGDQSTNLINQIMISSLLALQKHPPTDNQEGPLSLLVSFWTWFKKYISV